MPGCLGLVWTKAWQPGVENKRLAASSLLFLSLVLFLSFLSSDMYQQSNTISSDLSEQTKIICFSCYSQAPFFLRHGSQASNQTYLDLTLTLGTRKAEMEPHKEEEEQWLSHEKFGARANLAMAPETLCPSPTATRLNWVINGSSPASLDAGSAAVEPDSKSETPSKSRILGIAAGIGVGLVSVAMGAGFLLSKMGTADGDTDQEEDQKMMKAPDTGGRPILRKKFEENPSDYFRTRRRNGADAAVGAFGRD